MIDEIELGKNFKLVSLKDIASIKYEICSYDIINDKIYSHDNWNWNDPNKFYIVIQYKAGALEHILVTLNHDLYYQEHINLCNKQGIAFDWFDGYKKNGKEYFPEDKDILDDALKHGRELCYEKMQNICFEILQKQKMGIEYINTLTDNFS